MKQWQIGFLDSLPRSDGFDFFFVLTYLCPTWPQDTERESEREGARGGRERERERKQTDRGKIKTEKEIARRDQVRWRHLTNSHTHSQLFPSHTTTYHHLPKTLTTKHYYNALLSRWVGRQGQSVWDGQLCSIQKDPPERNETFFLSTYPNNQLTMHTKHKKIKTYFSSSDRDRPHPLLIGCGLAYINHTYSPYLATCRQSHVHIHTQPFLICSHRQYNTQIYKTQKTNHNLQLWQLGQGIHNMTCAQPWQPETGKKQTKSLISGTVSCLGKGFSMLNVMHMYSRKLFGNIQNLAKQLSVGIGEI